MALERKDRIRETTTTTGTGTLDLSGTAPTGFRTFVTAVTSGATVRYLIESADSTEWEVGEGVFTDATPDTLTRVTIYASSNAGSLVNFSAGEKVVHLTLTAADIQDDGWKPASETWTYASASTFTITGDVTTKYKVGDKIKYTQSATVKYAYIIKLAYSSPNTTVTISVSTDYTLANAVISSNCYSKVENPSGFPSTFSYTTSFTGFSADPTYTAVFSLKGALCKATVNMTDGGGTSNATNFLLSTPIKASTTNLTYVISLGRDNSNFISDSVVNTQSTDTDNFIARTTNLGVWTASGVKGIWFTIEYEINP